MSPDVVSGAGGNRLLDAPCQIVPLQLPIWLPAFVFQSYLFDG
jgi:hypothetical protein